MNPRGRYAKTRQEKWRQEEQDLVDAKPGWRSVCLDPRGRYAEKNGKSNQRSKTSWLQIQNVGRPLGHVRYQKRRKTSPGKQIFCYKARAGCYYAGALGGRYNHKNEKGLADPTNGLERQHETANVGPTGALNAKPMMDNVRPHHGSNSLNASPLMAGANAQ